MQGVEECCEIEKLMFIVNNLTFQLVRSRYPAVYSGQQGDANSSIIPVLLNVFLDLEVEVAFSANGYATNTFTTADLIPKLAISIARSKLNHTNRLGAGRCRQSTKLPVEMQQCTVDFVHEIGIILTFDSWHDSLMPFYILCLCIWLCDHYLFKISDFQSPPLCTYAYRSTTEPQPPMKLVVSHNS